MVVAVGKASANWTRSLSVKLHTMMYHKPTDMTYFPAHNAAQKVLNFGLGGSQTLTATLIAVSYLCGDIG